MRFQTNRALLSSLTQTQHQNLQNYVLLSPYRQGPWPDMAEISEIILDTAIFASIKNGLKFSNFKNYTYLTKFSKNALTNELYALTSIISTIMFIQPY